MTTASLDRPPPLFQFTLRQLLVAMAVVCVGCAFIYWFGFALGILAILLGASAELAARFAWRQQFGKAAGCILVAVFLGFMLLVISSLQQMAVRPASCQNNLRMVALALQLYHDTYNSFPPAYIADADGNPMHSWRVLLLPFLEQKALYNHYRFDEPWNSPNNAQIGQLILRVYQCPSDKRDLPTTSYLAVIGSETIWPGAIATKMSDIKDGPANTILLVEVHNSGIPWMEPRDLDFATMPMTVNAAPAVCISSTHHHRQTEFANIAFADGQVHAIPATASAKSLRAALTISGQEKSKLPTVRLGP
jgi:hypothetical protein